MQSKNKEPDFGFFWNQCAISVFVDTEDSCFLDVKWIGIYWNMSFKKAVFFTWVVKITCLKKADCPLKESISWRVRLERWM